MEMRKLEEGSRLVGATRWGAVATGAFAAVAIQTLLMLFGFAIASSVGDRVAGMGYALWALLAEVCAIAFGGALAASVGHAQGRAAGMAAGAMTWAVALVLGSFVTLTAFGKVGGSAAWSGFFGAVIGLAAGMVGGAFGARGAHASESVQVAG